MSLSPSQHSWRHTGSPANENSREGPSHWECHYDILGSAQTYIPWAWKHTCRCTEPCMYRDVYASVIVAHAYSNWYVMLTNLCMLTHLHMSIAVIAQAVIRGDRSYATSLGSPGAESQRDRDGGREMSFIHCHSPMTQPFLWFTHIPGFSSDEVTFELLHCVLMWLIPVVLVLSVVAHLNILLLVNLY